MRRSRLFLIVGIGAIVIGATGWWLSRPSPLPSPPEPDPAYELDPLCRALIEGTLARTVDESTSAEARADLAMVYHGNGLNALAVDAYRQALQADDSSARWWYHLARAEAELGRFATAIDAMDRSIERDGRHGPSHWNRGFWALELARLPDATTSFQNAVKLAPEEPAGHVGLARVHLLNQDGQAAIDQLTPLLQRLADPSYIHQLLGTAYQMLGRSAEAAQHANRASGRKPSWNEPWNLEVADRRSGYAAEIQRAEQMAAEGNLARALHALDQLRTVRPGDATVLTKIGELHLGSNELARAETALLSALQVDERSVHAHLHLSDLYLRRNDLTSAQQHAERAVELYPTLGHAHLAVAMVDLTSQRWARAERSLQDAIRCGVTDGDTLLNLTMSQYRQQKLPEASQTVQRLLNDYPDHFKGVILGCAIYADLGDRLRATKLFKCATELRPNDPSLGETARYIEAKTQR